MAPSGPATPPVRFLFVHAWRGFSLAEWYLRDALGRGGTPVLFRALDLPTDGTPASDPLERVVAAWQPDMVGFSCHYWSLSAFLAAAATVKRLRPEVTIVLGGPQVDSTASAEAALAQSPAVDFVVRGPGEEALGGLVGRVAVGVAPDAIPGLSFRAQGRVHHHAVDSVPATRHHTIFHAGNADLMSVLPDLHEVSYETVAGCRWRCAYCYYPNRTYTLHDEALVQDELAFLCMQRVPVIRICDTRFGGPAARAKRLLRHLRQANRGSRIWLYPDLAHVDEEYLQLLADAGAEITSIGIQSTNSRALRRVRRPSIDAQRARIRLMLTRFPWVPADVIVGLPGDDREGLERTFRDVMDLGFRSINVFRLMLFPGTALADDPAAFFAPEGPVVSEHGQVLFSGEFPRTDQAELARLVSAVELMAPLTRTRAHFGADHGGDALALAQKLDPSVLLDINRVLAPAARSALGSRCGWVIDTLAPLLGDTPTVRDCIAWDLAEVQSASANVEAARGPPGRR